MTNSRSSDKRLLLMNDVAEDFGFPTWRKFETFLLRHKRAGNKVSINIARYENHKNIKFS